MNSIDTVMVLAAGFGKRMQPLTFNTPKPLIAVAGTPLIDGVLNNIANVPTIKRVVVNTHYKAEKIHKHIAGIKSQYPFEILISHEEEILETGGGIVNALPLLGDAPFYIINSDNIWHDRDTSILTTLAEHYDGNTGAVLTLCPTDFAIGYDGRGDFFMKGNGALTLRGDAPAAPYVFVGIHLLDPKLLQNRHVECFSIMDVYRDHLAHIKGVELDGYWLHVGTPEGITLAEHALSERGGIEKEQLS